MMPVPSEGDSLHGGVGVGVLVFPDHFFVIASFPDGKHYM
jgi:hypothetical protein